MSYLYGLNRAITWVIMLTLLSCKGNPPDLGDFSGKESVYLFEGQSIYDVTGNILFQEKNDKSLLATLQLKNTTEGISHPAIIYFGSVDNPGSVALILEPVDGSTGTSITQFSELADTTPINFEELLILDAHIKIHQDGDNMTTILAATDLGQNSSSNPNIN